MKLETKKGNISKEERKKRLYAVILHIAKKEKSITLGELVHYVNSALNKHYTPREIGQEIGNAIRNKFTIFKNTNRNTGNITYIFIKR